MYDGDHLNGIREGSGSYLSSAGISYFLFYGNVFFFDFRVI